MATRPPRRVNNAVYASLGDRWYEADDDPIALLRAEARLHAPWIEARLAEARGRGARVLDVGCGAGFVANALVRRGFDLVGLDLADACLSVAARHDPTGRARWVRGDARDLPFDDATFDAVCAMDVLEHVEPVDRVVSETARVLRPGGLFFFHTFDRNPLSWLVIIKAVEWFVRNAPRDLHVHRMFIKPRELAATCARHGLATRELVGCEPKASLALARLAVTGVVPSELEFAFRKRPLTGYTGVAEKTEPRSTTAPRAAASPGEWARGASG